MVSAATDEFHFKLSLESTWWACREGLVDMGWEVECIESDRLVTRRSWWGFSRDPAKIEIRLAEAGPQATTIVLNGRIRWWGKRQLDGEMNRLRNAIEVAACRPPIQQI